MCLENTFLNFFYFSYRSSHTVSGHEAMHLAKRLNEELAQQNSRNYGMNRAISPEPETRSKSYENKSPQKGKGKMI